LRRTSHRGRDGRKMTFHGGKLAGRRVTRMKRAAAVESIQERATSRLRAGPISRESTMTPLEAATGAIRGSVGFRCWSTRRSSTLEIIGAVVGGGPTEQRYTAPPESRRLCQSY
jgi:hypothetical protein